MQIIYEIAGSCITLKKITFLTIISSALLSFCLFCFSPLYIFFSDPNRLGELHQAYVVQLFLIAIVATVGLSLPSLKLGKNYTLGLCFVCTVVFLYSYIVQINFGLFRGNKFGNEQLLFDTAKLAYYIEPIALLALFFLVRLIFHHGKIFFTVFFCFLFLSFSYDLSTSAREYLKSKPTNAKSDRNQLELGEIFRFSRNQQNILLIIPDAGAGYLVPELMEEDDRARQFDGFVNYPNTVSAGSYTMPSTAALIGGDRYFPDKINEQNDKPIIEHIHDAYNWLASTLKENGYESTFMDPVFNKCPNIIDATFCSRMINYKNALEGKYGFEAIPVFDEKAVRYFSLFKTLPFSLKPVLYKSAGWKSALEGSLQLAVSVNNKYHEYLMLRSLPELSVSEEDASSQFTLLWNRELIAPFNLDADCQPLAVGREDMYSRESRINGTRCVLDALARWLQWMMDNDVYDNTKIIIVADHGAGDYDNKWYKAAVNPILLVKDFDSRGPLETSDILMQNSDVAALICSALGECEGIGKDPSKFPDPERTAKYFFTAHGNYDFAEESRQFEIKKVFEIRGDVRDNPEFTW